HGPIAINQRQIADCPEHSAPGEVRLQFAADVFLEQLEIHTRSGDIGAEETREREKVVDQTAHALGGGCDLVQVALTLDVDLLVAVLAQQFGEAIKVSKRCAKVVGNRVRERF